MIGGTRLTTLRLVPIMPRMSNIGRLGCVGLTVYLIVVACSSAPTLSDDARTVHQVDALIVSLADAYRGRAVDRLMAGFAPSLSGNEGLRQAAEGVFARFNQIELTIVVDRMHLEGKTVTVFLHWDGRWRSDEKDPVARQGTARFVVAAGDPAVITEVIGENPFGAVPDGSAHS